MPPRVKQLAKPFKCDSCGGDEYRIIRFNGSDYPQCVKCKYWSTEAHYELEAHNGG